jgi:multiple sugar transport system permease protein
MMRNQAITVGKHLMLLAFGLVMLYPILWIIASSLKSEDEIFRQASSLLPADFRWENYVAGWRGFGDYGFDLFFKNSFIVAGGVLIGTFFSSTLTAFGFGRMQFKFKPFLFACLLATMMLPSQVMLIPQYIMFQKLGWVDTFLPLIAPAFIGGNAFFIFLLIQFVRGLPKELDEAATIDGCGPFGIFVRIILPLMKSGITTVMIFAFLWTWEDFMGPLIYLNNTSLYTVTRGLQMFADPQSITAWGPLLAMSALAILPQLIVFLLFQKNIVEGIATTGLKG